MRERESHALVVLFSATLDNQELALAHSLYLKRLLRLSLRVSKYGLSNSIALCPLP
jgi:hypothetical protein